MPKPFVAALADDSPRVRAQALISLGRLEDAAVAKSIFPLTTRPNGSTMPTQRPLQNQPDPDRVVPHLAVRALVALNAIDACLEALDGPHWSGALWAMRSMHDPQRPWTGLIKKLGTARTPELRRGILVTLDPPLSPRGRLRRLVVGHPPGQHRARTTIASSGR